MAHHPRYARFHKCDLQLQTPGDHHYWVGTATKLTPGASDHELAHAATLYVNRLYDVGLEVVGITDHNLGGELGIRFLDHLRRETEKQAGARRRRITVFPGFELEAKLAGRVHLLCLFEPGTSTEELNHALTALLGAPPGQRDRDAASNRDLDGILDCVEDSGGIVIAAHADRTKGALDDRQLADVWQRDVVTNERLLCIELCRPREAYAEVSGKLGMIVRNDEGPWQRSHPIAVVNSSDCKRLSLEDGKGDDSWIGKRHTWIKMGRPSIEGLRQAFLDHESRIRFGAARPEDEQHHDRIERISVQGVSFLENQDIELSPNLNTFIGGGGTGKSTLLEYLRGLIGRPPDTSGELIEAHRRTLTTVGTGTVTIELRQGDDRIKVNSNEVRHGAPLADRFPIVAFSQREVFAVASSQPATLALIDSLRRDRLEELARSEVRAREDLRSLDAELAALPQLELQHEQVVAEGERLAAALKTVEAQQQPLAILNKHRREAEAVTRIDAGLDRVATQIETFAQSVNLDIRQSGPRSLDTPHAEEVDALLARAQAAVAHAADQITRAATAVRETANVERQRPERVEWRAALERAQAEYEALRAVSGDNADRQPELLRRQLEDRRVEVAALADRIANLRERENRRTSLLAALRRIWEAQIAARREIANALRDLVPATESGEPYVDVEIRPFADTEPLRQALNDWVHGQALTDAEAAQVCQCAVDEVSGQNPVDIVVTWITDLQRGITPTALEKIGLRPISCKRLGERVTIDRLRELERTRLPDKAVVRLRRNDGTLAGSLDEGLSVGQRCTAIIALALAGGREPIIIDQPEDEIDNEFIYTELVPLLRKAKNQRQVIIATHNPNLPVNGDAELIYALEANRADRGVRGRPKRIGGDLAVGSLDRASVKAAVETIMEGSKEAFARRRARYGF